MKEKVGVIIGFLITGSPCPVSSISRDTIQINRRWHQRNHHQRRNQPITKELQHHRLTQLLNPITQRNRFLKIKLVRSFSHL